MQTPIPPGPGNQTYLSMVQLHASPPPGWQVLSLPAAMTQGVNLTDASTGFSPQAFTNPTTHQIVIAFPGIDTVSFVENQVSGGLLGTSAALNQGAYKSDMALESGGQNPSASLQLDALQLDVRNYVQAVINTAASMGIDPANVFVAGHSIGGYEAQVAAMLFPELGGGVSYGGPGVPGLGSGDIICN